MTTNPSYFVSDRGGYTVSSQIQTLATTPVGILAISVPTTAPEIRKLFLDFVKISVTRLTTVEVGIIQSSAVSGGTPLQQSTTGSPGSQSFMNCLVGNATTPIVISGAAPYQTYQITDKDTFDIDKDWIVLPGQTLYVRMTQTVAGTGSAGIEWRESL